ncbi:MAG: phasin family protein [Beijerinckiaceae bacterium]
MNGDMNPPAAAAAPESLEPVLSEQTRRLDEPVDLTEIAETIPEEIEGVAEVVRQSAELTIEQARASYDRMRDAAEETSKKIEAAVAAASSGVAELNLKAMDAVKTSTDAAFELVRAMADAKTFADVVSLQTEHMRKQIETMNAQSKEFAELAGKVSLRAMAPLNETFGKAFGAAV